jgi:hypothetical protein
MMTEKNKIQHPRAGKKSGIERRAKPGDANNWKEASPISKTHAVFPHQEKPRTKDLSAPRAPITYPHAFIPSNPGLCLPNIHKCHHRHLCSSLRSLLLPLPLLLLLLLLLSSDVLSRLGGLCQLSCKIYHLFITGRERTFIISILAFRFCVTSAARFQLSTPSPPALGFLLMELWAAAWLLLLLLLLSLAGRPYSSPLGVARPLEAFDIGRLL